MTSLKLRQNETILNALQRRRLTSEFSVTDGRVSTTSLLRSPACHKNANQPQSSCLLRRACKNMHSSFPSALFLIQEFLTCTIQIALTWWLGITLALKMLYTPFIFHPLHLTRTLVWQKQIRWHRCIHGLMFATLIRICDIERDKQNHVGAIKAPLSPAPPRHPRRRRACMWAGNLSGCRLAPTLKSTWRDELQSKALWEVRCCFTWADRLLSLTAVGGLGGGVDRIRQSV